MSVLAQVQELQAQLPTHREVKVVAVTKYCTLSQMIEAYDAGIRHFGENKIQDFLQKYDTLPPEIATGVTWHFLGHLQRNKVNKTLIHPIGLIHSVDSYELAQRLSEANQAAQSCQDVLLQLNITREPQKTGFMQEALHQYFPELLGLPGIRIQGLMTIGPNPPEEQASKAHFQHLHEVRDQLAHEFACPLPELSMGMSQDFNHAIECGATIIRIGNRFFSS